jgi:hypothetical protein
VWRTDWTGGSKPLSIDTPIKSVEFVRTSSTTPPQADRQPVSDPTHPSLRGTGSSNPSPSSGESCTKPALTLFAMISKALKSKGPGDFNIGFCFAGPIWRFPALSRPGRVPRCPSHSHLGSSVRDPHRCSR